MSPLDPPAAASAGGPEREARAALSTIGEPGDPRLLGLVAERGAVEVLARLRAQAAGTSALGERLAGLDGARVLDDAAERGIGFLIPGDPHWPDRLDDLARLEPLQARGGTPLGLWVSGHGDPQRLLAEPVAVVGSRSATTYGARVAGEIASGLAEAGRPVVSGAAFGIDAAVHRGALAVAGGSVAVLASGVDRPSPAAHAALAEAVAETGLLLSEAPPGAHATRIRFLARNRLIAALGVGTVVVEAALRSGALNTAHWAAELSRVLMGVPGPVTSMVSAGVHEMMRSRGALVVTGAADVLEAVSPAGERTVGTRRAGSGTPGRVGPGTAAAP